MRLTAIEIENFKGIGPRQRIELKPITLLFGPNSAGKSTILQALHYVREILERQNVDPDVTIAGGLLNLGGFRSLVHEHDLNRSVRLKLEIEVSPFVSLEELPLNSEGYTGTEGDFSNLSIPYGFMDYGDDPASPGALSQVGLELEIRWSNQRHCPYVSRWATELNGELIGVVTSVPEEGQAILTECNFRHPLLTWNDTIRETPSDPFPVQTQVRELSRQTGLDESVVREVSRHAGLDETVAPTGSVETRVTVGTIFGALLDLDRPLRFDFRDPEAKKLELEDKTPRVRALVALLSELMLGPARVVRNYLSRMTYIGPLREIPGRDFIAQFSPNEARWAHGLAAWDLLYGPRGRDLIDKVNHWLFDKERLNTGYRLERVDYRKIPVPSPIDIIFQRGVREEDLPDLQELYEQASIDQEVVLRDVRTGTVVGPSDVGVGLSQLVPVIVSIVAKDDGLIAIEQPELHLHPAVQIGLGDLLARAVDDSSTLSENERCMLIETHSEHIMLRLLRRIRQTAEDKLPPGTPALLHGQVAVIYVEPTEDQLNLTPLRIAADGDFLDRWPHGFFQERGEELFG